MKQNCRICVSFHVFFSRFNIVRQRCILWPRWYMWQFSYFSSSRWSVALNFNHIHKENSLTTTILKNVKRFSFLNCYIPVSCNVDFNHSFRWKKKFLGFSFSSNKFLNYKDGLRDECECETLKKHWNKENFHKQRFILDNFIVTSLLSYYIMIWKGNGGMGSESDDEKRNDCVRESEKKRKREKQKRWEISTFMV